MKKHGQLLISPTDLEVNMLKIINSDIELEIIPIEKVINTPEPSFYHEWMNMYVEFKSKGITYQANWGCYSSELNELKQSLLALKNNTSHSEIKFSPNEGMITLFFHKHKNGSTYYLKYKFYTEVRSSTFIEGETTLGELNIDELLIGLNWLTQF